MELDGVAILVTGGASGIGEASVWKLAERGARVAIADLNEERGGEIAEKIGGVFVKTDVANEVDVAAAVQAASELAPLRGLVNAAGVGHAKRTVDREGNPFPLGDFERVIRINLVGSFNCLRLAAAEMARNEPVDEGGQRGAIVNLSSVAAFEGQTGQAAYSASKGGVVGMTLPIARDLVAVGVRVNTIAPGLVDTPIYGTGEAAEQFKAHLGQSVLFPRRLGDPSELASMVVELLTNDYMNAAVVRVDGGIRMPPK